MDRALGKRLRIIHLLDVYGVLLTERQRTLLRLYYHHDLSLGEIGGQLKISRQAVFDTLHRSVAELEHLETCLKFVERQKRAVQRQRRAVGRVDALENNIQRLSGKVSQRTVNRILDDLTALRKTMS